MIVHIDFNLGDAAVGLAVIFTCVIIVVGLYYFFHRMPNK